MLKKQLQELPRIGLGGRDMVALGGHQSLAALCHFLGLPQDQVGAGGQHRVPPGEHPQELFLISAPWMSGTHESQFWAMPQELKSVAVHVGVRITMAPISWCACHAARGVMDGPGGCVGQSCHLTSNLKTGLQSRER